MAKKNPTTTKKPSLVTAIVAARILGVSFSRFKVAIWRGLGLSEDRAPQGSEAKPVKGGWSGKLSLYAREDIEKMAKEYRWRKPSRTLSTKVKVLEDHKRTLSITLEPWEYACLQAVQREINKALDDRKMSKSKLTFRATFRSVLRRSLISSIGAKDPKVQELMQESKKVKAIVAKAQKKLLGPKTT